MKLSQYIFTNCANNGTRGGYVEYGRSQDISDDDARFIQQTLDYKLRSKYAYNGSPETIDSTYPRKLAFFPLPSGRYCFGQSSYIGLDSGGNRYGNYMIHAFVIDDPKEIDPYQFYRNDVFRLRLTQEELMGPVAGVLPQLEVAQPHLPNGSLHIENDDAFKVLMVYLRDRNFAPTDKIYIRCKEEDYSTLLNLISYCSKPGESPIPFMTYLNSELEYKDKINLLFETEPIANVKNRVFGNFNIHYFDLIENKTDVELEIGKVDQEWLSILKNDVVKAKEFMNDLEEIKTKYRLDNSLEAFTVKILIDKQYERIASMDKVLELYTKFLHPYHPSDIADDIYHHLSELDKNNSTKVNLLFEDFSPALRKEIIQNFIINAFSTNTYVTDTIQALNRVPYGSYQSLLNVLFERPFFDELQNKGETAKLTLLALTKDENVALELERQIEDKNKVLTVFTQFLSMNRFASLATILFDELEVDRIALKDLKVLYPYLSKEKKERLVLRSFDETIKQGLSYFDTARNMIENNVLVAKEEAATILCNYYFASLIRTDATDKDKKIALVLTNYINVNGDQVLAIYDSLESRNDEQVVFDLVANLYKTNNKRLLVERFLSQNISFYHAENDVIRLLNKLSMFNDIRSNVFLTFVDSKVYSFERALDYLPQLGQSDNPRIQLMRNISENRNRPEIAKQFCERRMDDPISQIYLQTLYTNDLKWVIRGANTIPACLENIEKYNLERDDLEHCLNVIYNTNLTDLHKSINLRQHEILMQKAMMKNISINKNKVKQLEFLFVLNRYLKEGVLELDNEIQQFGNVSFYTKKQIPLDEEFALLSYDYTIKLIEKVNDKNAFIDSLIVPLMQFDSIKQKFINSDVKLLTYFIDYMRKAHQSNPFVPLIVQAINNLLNNDRGERRINIDRLQLTEEEVHMISPKKGGATTVLKIVFFPFYLLYKAFKKKNVEPEQKNRTQEQNKPSK